MNAPRSSRFETLGVATRRVGPALRLAWIALFASAAGVALFSAVRFERASFAFAAFAASTIALFLLQRGGLRLAEASNLRPTPVIVEVDRLVIEADGPADTIQRALIADVWADGSAVIVRLIDDDSMVVEMADEARARELVEALAPAAPRSAASSFRLADGPAGVGTAGRGVGLVAASLVALLGLSLAGARAAIALEHPSAGNLGWTALAMLVALGLLYLHLLALRFFGPPRLVIGADGLAVVRLGRSRFTPYAALGDVRVDQDGVLVARPKGDALWLPAPGLTASALAARIRQNASRAANSTDDANARLLDRAGRTLDAWRADLRRLVGARPGYREVSIGRDDLARLLEDGRASSERRIAAALALGADRDEALRQRIRAAIAGCANEPLREALEKATADDLDEDALDRAIAPASRASTAG